MCGLSIFLDRSEAASAIIARNISARMNTTVRSGQFSNNLIRAAVSPIIFYII